MFSNMEMIEHVTIPFSFIAEVNQLVDIFECHLASGKMKRTMHILMNKAQPLLLWSLTIIVKQQ